MNLLDLASKIDNLPFLFALKRKQAHMLREALQECLAYQGYRASDGHQEVLRLLLSKLQEGLNEEFEIHPVRQDLTSPV